MSGRRSRAATAAALIAGVVLAALALRVVFDGSGDGSPDPDRVGDRDHAGIAVPALPDGMRPCTVGDLLAAHAFTDGTMGRRVTQITVMNSSGTACGIPEDLSVTAEIETLELAADSFDVVGVASRSTVTLPRTDPQDLASTPVPYADPVLAPQQEVAFWFDGFNAHGIVYEAPKQITTSLTLDLGGSLRLEVDTGEAGERMGETLSWYGPVEPR